MKKNEFKQIKGLDTKELNVKAKALKEEIANLTLDKNMKKLKDLKMISKKKKELAQMLTVIRQKELLEKIESRIKEQESSSQKEKQTDTVEVNKTVKDKDLKLKKRKEGKA